MRLRNRTFGVLCTVPGLVALVALIIYPCFYNVVLSFARYSYATPMRFVGLRNYEWLFSAPDFYRSWLVSLVYSVGSTLLAFLVALTLAHALSGIRRGKAFFRTLIILPWAFPPVLSGLTWKWLLNTDIGIINYMLSATRLIDANLPFLSDSVLALLSGIVATAYIHIPFMTVLMLAGLESIPSELYEAARIDGADEVQKFWHVSAPLNRPQMIVSVVVVVLFTFRTPDILFSLTGGGPGKATYHAGLFLMDMLYRFLNFGRGAAIGVIMFLTVVLLVVPVLSRGFARGRSA